MQARFTTSIASEYWSYAPDQIVTLGKVFSAEEVPSDIGKAWMSSGVLTSVAAPKVGK